MWDVATCLPISWADAMKSVGAWTASRCGGWDAVLPGCWETNVAMTPIISKDSMQLDSFNTQSLVTYHVPGMAWGIGDATTN